MITQRVEYHCDRCLKTELDPPIGEFVSVTSEDVGSSNDDYVANSALALPASMHLCRDCAVAVQRSLVNYDPGAPLSGAERIAKERERQITEKGWTAEHDDEHADEHLLAAAICYAVNKAENHQGKIITGFKEEGSYFSFTTVIRSRPPIWPWDPKFDKREATDRMTSLAKAGALIAAEYDRLQRESVSGDKGA